MASAELKKVIAMAREMKPMFLKPPHEIRGAWEAMAEPVASDVGCEPADAGGVKAEWITPPGAEMSRVILYLHGGGYVCGSIITHQAMVARMAQASRARAIILDYRLAPEHPYPAALEDALASYRWLLKQGYKPNRMAVAGDSAGGGLALAMMVSLRDSGAPLPAAGVLLSPWTDLEQTGASIVTRAEADPVVCKETLVQMARDYVGSANPRDPLISPLHANLSGLPPLLIQVADAEVMLDDATRVAERAKAAGVKVELEVWPEVIHIWHRFTPLPEGERATQRIGQFVGAHTP